MKILLGTKNAGKIREIQSIFQSVASIQWLTFEDIPFRDVIENGTTFCENAHKKASQISAELYLPVLAEDSGLEVDALDGAPGIQSARYAGPNANDGDRILKLLSNLADFQSEDERRGRFRCCAELFFPESYSIEPIRFESILSGHIAEHARGDGGFGYDPIFIPDGFDQTLAELGSELKNSISHRRIALAQFIPHLKKF